MYEKSKIVKIASNPAFYELENRQWVKKTEIDKLGGEIGYEVEYEYEEKYGKKIVTKILSVKKIKTQYDIYFEEFGDNIKNDKKLQEKYFESGVEEIAKTLTNKGSSAYNMTDEGVSASKMRKYYEEYKNALENNSDLINFLRLKALVYYDAGRCSKKEKKYLGEFAEYINAVIDTTKKYFENKELLNYLKKHFESLIAYATYYKNK